jgi:hypothetical protein
VKFNKNLFKADKLFFLVTPLFRQGRRTAERRTAERLHTVGQPTPRHFAPLLRCAQQGAFQIVAQAIP